MIAALSIWQLACAVLAFLWLLTLLEMRRMHSVHHTLTYNLEATIRKYFDLYEKERELRKAYEAQCWTLERQNLNLTQHNNALYAGLAPPVRTHPE